jgi:hypothetical protein
MKGSFKVDQKQIIDRLNRLEYHQSLLMNMVSNNRNGFYKLVIEKSLDKSDVEQFYKLCEELSVELEKQKAEGFVYFNPLFEEFKLNLHPKLDCKEVINACLNQQIFEPLMMELKNYLY